MDQKPDQKPDQDRHRRAWRTAARWWHAARADLRSRWAAVRAEPDAGYSTETVVVTGLLVVAALVVIAIIVAKVTDAANAISLVGG